MKSRSHILIKTECMIIMLLLTSILHGQVDPGTKSTPAEELQNNLEIVRHNGDYDKDAVVSQTRVQGMKKKDEAGKNIKEVKSSSPDLKKARKGARPPYISRPAGSARPQGAGKPAGAGRSGRR